MRVLLAAIVFGGLVTTTSHAAIYYADDQLASDCTSSDYNPVAHDCTGSDGNAYNTITEAITAMSPGDTVCIRPHSSGYWTTKIVVGGSKTGTSESARLTIGGCDGEIPAFKVTDSAAGTGTTSARGNRGYITFRNMEWDGTNLGDKTQGIQIRDGNHHFTLDNIEIHNGWGTAVGIGGDYTVVRNCHLHDNSSMTNATGWRHYGFYVGNGDNVLLENNTVYHMSGGGMQTYNALTLKTINNIVIRNNVFYENNYMEASQIPGILVSGANAELAVQGAQVYGNVIYRSGKWSPGGIFPATGGGAGGITMQGYVTSPKIYNNTVYDVQRYGIHISGPNVTGAEFKNNIVIGSDVADYSNAGTGTTGSHNATISSVSIGTNRITITDIDDCAIDGDGADFRLRTGTNPCRDAGTSVSTRPSPVGVTDVGAFEQGRVDSATVASTFIEVTVNVMTPGVLPTSGITGFTIANGTSTGTPVVSSAAVKPGSSNVIQLTVSGFTGSGTCTISYSGGNVTDSGYVGRYNDGILQGINTASGVSVSGPCDNSAGGTPPAGSLHIHHTVDEGTGTSLNDETANNLDSTLSGSPTWTSNSVSGSALSFASGQDQRVTFAYGNAVNATSQSFTFCVWAKADTGMVNKIIMGPSFGTNMRMYVGSYTGQTWQLGVGSSSYSATGESEFAVSTTYTRLCVINNATTDTVTLAVNGVKGTSAAAVKSSASVTALASHFLIGCGFSGTSYCGGYTIDEPKIWTLALSDAELVEDYQSYTPPGGSVGGYKQQDFQAQRVYLDGSSDPINYGSAGASSIEVVAGGAVALVMQVDCTGGACGPLAMQWVYSKNGGAYEHGIPLQFTADGIAMWGSDTDASLNRFTVSDCVSGALTENYGPTQLVAGATPTIELAQNHSYCIRAVVKFAASLAQEDPLPYFQIKLGQDNGADLDGGAVAIPRFDIVPPRASGGF